MENGLEKLRSTASQVDELKAKLAIQEIELQQKNEAADKLIEIVGVETAKVQSEKALGMCFTYVFIIYYHIKNEVLIGNNLIQLMKRKRR